MNFVRASCKGRSFVGILIGDRILDLSRWLAVNGGSMAGKLRIACVQDVIENFSALEAPLSLIEANSAQIEPEYFVTSNDVELLAPLNAIRKNIFCVGRNYLEHAAEGDRAQGKAVEPPKHPQFFTKPSTTIVGPNADVLFHSYATQQFDYEVELAVIIGKAGSNISRANAMDHVFGYSIINDLTARDLQRLHGQWFKGKSLDGSCPFGPSIVHKSRWSASESHQIELSVNGDRRQRSVTTNMIFPIDEIIHILSTGLTLEVGDIIATGTPAGVGYAMTPPVFLKDGDIVVAEIEGIGKLNNLVREVNPLGVTLSEQSVAAG